MKKPTNTKQVKKLKWTVIKDEIGLPIKDMRGVIEYKGSLVVFTEHGIYTDNPEIFQ